MKIQVGIHPYVGKPLASAKLNQAAGWGNELLTTDELIERVAVRGYAFSAHFKDGYRKTLNFICSGVIAADFDDGTTLDEMQKITFVRDFASFAYTTASHTDDHHRLRILFVLDETVTTAKDWANALLGLAIKLGSDRSIKDAGRQFYGNPNATVIRFDKTLPGDEFRQLCIVGRDERARRKEGVKAPLTSAMRLRGDLAVRTRWNEVLAFSSLSAGQSIFCPYHADEKASAFVVRSNAGGRGVHCMACNMTFWPEDQESYQFDGFERLTRERATVDRAVLSRFVTGNVFEAHFPPAPSVSILRQNYLPPLSYKPGITLVRSPKGSGKTEAQRALAQQIRKCEFNQLPDKSEHARSILSIGHRQSLSRQSASRLEFSCYLDWPNRRLRRFFTICLDSLPLIMEERNEDGKKIKPLKYDVVIIDESEQVFSHLLSDTIKKGAGAARVFHALDRCLRQAKAVYALDADLGLLTAHVLRTIRPKDWESSCRVIYNDPAPPAVKMSLRLYSSRKALEKEMIDAIRAGKRCFITTNRKSAVDVIRKMIEQEFGDSVSMRWVTSENSRVPEVRRLVENIQTEFLKFQVLVCSPSLGTGIDITFPDGRCEVDEVFGFFFPFVNMHTDIDQQLARVRNPGRVSAWVSKTRLNFETSFDVIRHDLATSRFVPIAVTGLDDDGRVEYDKDHPLLLIQSHVVCARRASMRNLYDNFKALREKNGWEVLEINEEGGASLWESARKALVAERAAGILAADQLSEFDYVQLKARVDLGERISNREKNAFERAELQRGIAVPLDPYIVALDTDRRLLQRVEAFKGLFGTGIHSSCAQLADRLFVSAEGLKKDPHFVLVGVSLALAGIIEADGRLRTERTLVHPDLNRFAAVCHTYRTLFEEVFGFPLAKNVERNPVKQLNRFLKAVGLKFEKVDRRRHGGKATFSYRLDPDRWEFMCRLAGLGPTTLRRVSSEMEAEAAE